MLNFIRRWLFNKSRYVFSYWNGSQIVKADPLTIWRDLQNNEDYREEDFRLMKVEALRSDLTLKFSKIVRTVFSIAPSDAGGLTELECLDVLRSYIQYTGFQKKSGDQIQTWPQSTDTEASATSDPEKTANDDLDST